MPCCCSQEGQGCWLDNIQVLNQCSARLQCHSYVKVNICVLPSLTNSGVGAASPLVLPVPVRPLRPREGVTAASGRLFEVKMDIYVTAMTGY